MAIRQVVGVVGAVIGGYIGGPSGAQYGWSIGTIVGGIVDPLVLDGPKVGEVAQQTSQEGGPRPIVFALSPPMAGNIIVAGPLKKHTHKEDQGKGGPKVKVTTLFRTYAIGVCEGPITRFVRVWRNGELVFDDKDDDEENYYLTGNVFADAAAAIIRARKGENNQQWLESVNFHLGAYDQDVDPDLEAIFGVGTTPAHRGTAYMTLHDDDVTDLRGAIPQYMFQVERCEGYMLTSRPYAVESIDALDSRGTVERKSPEYLYGEAMESGGSVVSGSNSDLLEEYGEWPPEALDSTGSVISGSNPDIIEEYTDWPPEALDSTGSIESGTNDTILISYTDAEAEAIDSGGSVESGSLT